MVSVPRFPKKEYDQKLGGLTPKQRRKATRLIKKEFARGYLDGLLKLLGPQHLCIDLGANVGAVTGLLAQTGARVISFEPDPNAFAVLSENVGHYSNVTLHQQAVGLSAGSVAFLKKEGMHDMVTESGSIVAENKNVGETGIEVEVIDFPAFLRETLDHHGKISFLKMDIEGSELELMEHLVQTELLTQINATVVETHERLIPGSRPRYNALRKIATERPDFNLNLRWL